VGSSVGRKQKLKENVYDAALTRIRDIFDRADEVTVGFSGGKDSTVCLNLALKVARERDRLPLKVHFFDEEAIPPETVEYVERVARLKDVDLRWWCLPIAHRNGCSRSEPFWYPWDRRDEHRWTRDFPGRGIASVPGFLYTHDYKTHTSIPTVNHLIADPKVGISIHIMGLRADESIRRYQSVSRSTKDNYFSTYTMPKMLSNGKPQMINSKSGRKGMTMIPCPWVQLASPIYDWSDRDVWRFVQKEKCDYNVAYDIYRMLGITASAQRVCPPYGEQPMQSLWTFKQAWPQLWDKMVGRVDGAATAALYARTSLYSYGKKPKRNPEVFPLPMNFVTYLIKKHPPKIQKKVAESVKWLISLHNKQTGNKKIPEDKLDPRTGVSWGLLYMIAMRGDLKDRAYNLAVTTARVRSGSRVMIDRKVVKA